MARKADKELERRFFGNVQRHGREGNEAVWVVNVSAETDEPDNWRTVRVHAMAGAATAIRAALRGK